MRITHKKLVWVAIIVYALIFGTVSVLRHQQFKTQTWDMAIFDQTMWNTTQGHVMQNSIEEVSNHLGVHMSPFLFVLLPGYALLPSPYFLLVVQASALALGALPLFLLAKQYLKERIALIISLVYLVYPSLHAVNLFDFHPIVFLIPTLLAGFYFLEIKRWLLAATFLILAASTKEDAVLVVMFLGIFLIIRSLKLKETTGVFKKDWWSSERKAGLIIFLLSLAYFIISVKVLMPMFGGGLLRVDRYSHLGTGFGEIIKNVFVNPGIYIDTIFTKVKLVYLLWLFAPLLFLPLFSWRTMILLIPGLLENLLTNYDSQFSGVYQYDSILIPSLFIAVILNLSLFLKKQSKTREIWFVRAIYIVVAVVFLTHSPLVSKDLIVDLSNLSDEEKVYAFLVSTVPNNSSVAAYTRMVPHLSGRESVSMLGYEKGMADVLLVDASKSFGFSNRENFQNYIDGYINSGQYSVKIIDEKYYIIFHNDVNLNLGGYE